MTAIVSAANSQADGPEPTRELLETEAVITVESVGEVLAKLETLPPVTMVEVAPVNLASFDQLCTEMGVWQ